MHFDYAQYKQKGFVQFIILGVVVLAIVAAGAFYFGRQAAAPKPQAQISQATPSFIPTASPAQNGFAETVNPGSIGANWKTYTSSKYSFSIKYPADWNVKESSPVVHFSPFSTIDPDSPRSISVEVIDRSIAPPLPAVPRYKTIRSTSLGKETVNILQSSGSAGELYLVKTSIGKYDFGFYFGLNLDRKYDPVFDQMLASFTFLQ